MFNVNLMVHEYGNRSVPQSTVCLFAMNLPSVQNQHMLSNCTVYCECFHAWFPLTERETKVTIQLKVETGLKPKSEWLTAQDKSKALCLICPSVREFAYSSACSIIHARMHYMPGEKMRIGHFYMHKHKMLL